MQKPKTKNDITKRIDIETVIRDFYTRALQDQQIGFFFTEVINLDIEKHLPHICDFWDQNLFHSGTYKNNVLKIHQNLNHKVALEKIHFEQWLKLFNTSVDDRFKGLNADKMKTNALSIATVLQIRLRK